MVFKFRHSNRMRGAQVYSVVWSSIFLSTLNITTCNVQPRRYSKLCSAGEYTRICIPEDYMKFELPTTHEPTNVAIGVDIKDIPKVKDKDFSITLNAYFIAKWRDIRLEIHEKNRTSPRLDLADEAKLIPVNPEVFSKRLWLPDVGEYIVIQF